jgi:hypothetical protein
MSNLAQSDIPRSDLAQTRSSGGEAFDRDAIHGGRGRLDPDAFSFWLGLALFAAACVAVALSAALVAPGPAELVSYAGT